MEVMQTIALIGYGNFGRFVHGFIPDTCQVLIYEPQTPAAAKPLPRNARLVDVHGAATADIIVLAIPLESYPALLTELAHRLKPESLVVDVCSIKTKPEEYFQEFLPNHRSILLTHPLFGPQSAQGGVAGHSIIVTKQQGELAGQVVDYLENNLQLRVSLQTSREHDQAMAQIHALTFFLARGLDSMGLQPADLQTPSYAMILELVKFNQTHSDELYRTIELGNPFAPEIRQRFITTLTDLNKELNNDAAK